VATKGDLTRQAIIKESMQLFSVKGYFNTSIDSLVQATGLTKGGIYGHFRNKEEIWYAVYDECARIWKRIVFTGVREISDPLARIEKVIENSLQDYLGGDVFAGGCFLLNALVDVSGQSAAMTDHVLRGFRSFSEMLRAWLEEAEQQGRLKAGLNLGEIATFLVISLNGTAPMYASGRDATVWRSSLAQLQFYINQLRKQP
jgi:TetR/AcrR family transcriptional regulator, transcriptional repressor for nem operon